jgi:membrane-bound inhibitor of C-type lysozyme
MRSKMLGPVARALRITVAGVSTVLLGACLQTAPVVVTPQDQAARLLYSCPNGKSLDVTRVQSNSAALVVLDGKTVNLPRDTATTASERYTNRLQTLTLYGNSASFDTLGQATVGPCTIGSAPGVPGSTPEQGRGSRSRDRD